METYTGIKDFIYNPSFHKQRQNSLNRLDIKSIDKPIVDIVAGFAKLSYCFTLQCCYGHFLHGLQKDSCNTEPLTPSNQITRVEYRIAYIAFCIENCENGKVLFKDLKDVALIDTDFIQFGCAEWFWNKHVNSYVLQVEPKRYKKKDKIYVDYQEAFHIQEMRDSFFVEIRKLLQRQVEQKD